MHLRHPRFTYDAWGLFTKDKGRSQKLKIIDDSIYIYIHISKGSR